MDRKEHWQQIYKTKSDQQMSWYEEEPAISLDLVREVSAINSSVIDIGGGASLLAARLVGLGFNEVTVLDISQAAIDRAKIRSAEMANKIHWIVGDVTEIDALPPVDVWHDRAVFHFLIGAEERARYSSLAKQTIQLGGHLIIGTFALDGPDKCSGLAVERYDSEKLRTEFEPEFALRTFKKETYLTPFGTAQEFIFAVFRRGP